MEVTVDEDHIQFMLHITFRLKTVSQLEKEKKKVVEVTHTNYDIFAGYDSEGSLFRGAAFFLVCVFHKLDWTFICIKTT